MSAVQAAVRGCEEKGGKKKSGREEGLLSEWNDLYLLELTKVLMKTLNVLD